MNSSAATASASRLCNTPRSTGSLSEPPASRGADHAGTASPVRRRDVARGRGRERWRGHHADRPASCRAPRTVSPYAAPPLREELVRPQRTIREKEITHSFPFSFYSAQGACGKPRVVPHNRRLRPEPTEMG